MRQERWLGRVLVGCVAMGWLAAVSVGCNPQDNGGETPGVDVQFPQACVGQPTTASLAFQGVGPKDDAVVTLVLPTHVRFEGEPLDGTTKKFAQGDKLSFVCDKAGEHSLGSYSLVVNGQKYEHGPVTIVCKDCSDAGTPDGGSPEGGTEGGTEAGAEAGTEGGTDGGGTASFERPACQGTPTITGGPYAAWDSEGTEPFFLSWGMAQSVTDHVALTIIDSCDASGCTTHQRLVNSPDPANTDYVEARPGTGAVSACGDLVRAEFALTTGTYVPGVWAFSGPGPAHMSKVNDASSFSNDASFAAENASSGLQLHVLAPSATEGVVATETLDLGISPSLYSGPFVCDAAGGTPSRPGCFVFSTDTALVAGDTDTVEDVYSLDVAGGAPYTPTRILQGANVVDVTPGTGRFVVVRSRNDLDGNSAGLSDKQVFVLDRDVSGDGTLDEAGDTAVERVSNRDDGEPVAYVSSWGTISDDGRFVTYVGRPNLSTATTAGKSSSSYSHENLFVHDRKTGQLALISQSASGETANADITGAQITPDGKAVLFYTAATNLDPNDTDPTETLYIAENPLAK